MPSSISFMPFSFPSPSIYSFPFIVALLCFGIAVLIILLRLRSLHNYRKRRNIVFYTAVLLILGVLIFQIYDAPRRAYVDFGLDLNQGKAYSDQTNQVVLSCQNRGNRATTFTLVLRCANASFQPQQNYILVDNQTVKVPFSLRENCFSGATQNQVVPFIVDENVEDFSFSLSVEQQSYGFNGASGITSATYVWNSTQNCYVPGIFGGFVV